MTQALTAFKNTHTLPISYSHIHTPSNSNTILRQPNAIIHTILKNYLLNKTNGWKTIINFSITCKQNQKLADPILLNIRRLSVRTLSDMKLILVTNKRLKLRIKKLHINTLDTTESQQMLRLTKYIQRISEISICRRYLAIYLLSTQSLQVNIQMIRAYPNLLQFSRYRRLRRVIYIALNRQGWALQHTPHEYRDYRHIVKTAISKEGRALQFASTRLRNNFDIVYMAVKNNGLALKYAPKRLQKYFKIVSTAVENNGLALRFADPILQKNESIVLKAVENNGLALRFANPILRNHETIVTKAIEQNGLALKHIGSKLSNIEEVALRAVQQNGLALLFVGISLQTNKPVILTALRQNRKALKYVNKEMLQDPEIQAFTMIDKR